MSSARARVPGRDRAAPTRAIWRYGADGALDGQSIAAERIARYPTGSWASLRLTDAPLDDASGVTCVETTKPEFTSRIASTPHLGRFGILDEGTPRTGEFR